MGELDGRHYNEQGNYAHDKGAFSGECKACLKARIAALTEQLRVWDICYRNALEVASESDHWWLDDWVEGLFKLALAKREA